MQLGTIQVIGQHLVNVFRALLRISLERDPATALTDNRQPQTADIDLRNSIRSVRREPQIGHQFVELIGGAAIVVQLCFLTKDDAAECTLQRL
jgi:hypothetical protein